MKFWWLILLFSVSCIGGGINRKNKEGAELYREGKLDEALAAFTQAQVDSPDAPEIHYNIGNVHYRKEEMDKAVEEYRAALRGGINVQQPAHYNTGNVRYRGQDFAGAVDAFKQALKIDPGDIEARQNLELALRQQQEQQEQQGGGGESDEDDEQQSEPQSQQEQEDQQQREQEQQQQSQQDQREMSQDEAERLLAALAEMEKAEQRRQQQKQQIKVRGKKKDW